VTVFGFPALMFTVCWEVKYPGALTVNVYLPACSDSEKDPSGAVVVVYVVPPLLLSVTLAPAIATLFAESSTVPETVPLFGGGVGGGGGGGVGVGLGVGVGTGVGGGVGVGLGVGVGVDVGAGVGVAVGPDVGVGDGAGVGVDPGVGVAVVDAVGVGVGPGVEVCVGVGDAPGPVPAFGSVNHAHFVPDGAPSASR
jgi:hypothetical protein